MASARTVKTEHMKKSEVVKEIHQLRIKVQNMEKEKETHLYNKSNDFRQEFSQLQELDQKLEAERKTERIQLVQHCDKIRNMVKRFHAELKDVKPTPEFVEKLKVIMEDIESQITTFKDGQRKNYEELLRDERISVQEVSALEKRFESWSQKGHHQGENAAKTPAPSQKQEDRDLPPEVLAFERFVQRTGGPRGGWDEYDHGTFLKYRNRHKGRLTFLRDLIPALPTKTEQEVKVHEQWYQEYLSLNDSKKQAIEKWKEKKEIEKEEMMAQGTVDEVDEEEEAQRRAEEQRRLIEQERLEKKLQLNRWKVERELEKAEKEEQRLKKEMMEGKKKEKTRQQQVLTKMKVEEYKHKRKQEEDHQKMEEEMREIWETEAKAKAAAKIIGSFQQRDKQKLDKRVSKEKAKQKEELEKQARAEARKQQIDARVPRDPHRLHRLTAGWEERQKNTGPTGTGPVLHMPHRAVPTWRQGMH